MSKLLKNIWKNKIFAGLFLALFTICSVIYYGFCYYKENSLIFTLEDSFILAISAICFILMSLLLVFIIFDNRRLHNITYDLIAALEDSNVLLHRNTQDFIMRINKKRE